MSLAVNFSEASLGAMALAKVGNPSRDEPLQTSKTLCHFQDEEAELLTHCFLKSFKSLELHQLHHHTAVESNEMFGYATKIFEDPGCLLEEGANISRHLHAQSNHPNIKAGDLCMSMVSDILVAGEKVEALCLIKSESKVPFLQIAVVDGDLRLSTQQGIYPDKIDKGCLILNHNKSIGYSVYLFDKSGNTNFWNREFVGAVPVKTDDYLTRRYSELCVDFAQKGLPEEAKQEERMDVAKRAIDYISDSEDFSMDEFREVALKDPATIEQFDLFKDEFEEETGTELEDKFTVSKGEAAKAKKKLRGKMKLDVGVELKFSSGFIDQADSLLEKGFDEAKHMNYVKIYYHEEN